MGYTIYYNTYIVLYNLLDTLYSFGYELIYSISYEGSLSEILISIPDSVPLIGGWSILSIITPGLFTVYIGYVFIKWVLDIVL